MRPLERRPGNDPGFPDCAAWACPLHSARMDELVCPGTPTGSRHYWRIGEGGIGPPFWRHGRLPPRRRRNVPKTGISWPPIYRLTMRRNPGGDPLARACRR